MAVSENKTRTLFTLEKEFKKELEEEAKKQNRSFSNLVQTILKDYMASR